MLQGAYARLQDCKVASFCLLRLNWEFTRTKLKGPYSSICDREWAKEVKKLVVVSEG